MGCVTMPQWDEHVKDGYDTTHVYYIFFLVRETHFIKLKWHEIVQTNCCGIEIID